MSIIKKNFNLFILFYIIFIMTTMRFFTTYGVNMGLSDSLCQYLQSRKIADGMIPYKDFNMVTTPLYYFISSISIKINRTFLSKLLFDDVLMIFYYYLVYLLSSKVIKRKILSVIYITLNIFILGFGYSYNTFCLFLALFSIYLLTIRYNKIYIFVGITIGLCLLTKQTIGGLFMIVLFIDILIFSKNKKVDLLNYTIGLFIDAIIFVLYLLLSESFYEFFDYCLFGAKSFENNLYINLLGVLFLSLSCINLILFAIYMYKNKLVLNNTTLLFWRYYLYIFFISIVLSYPIFDFWHTVPTYALSLLFLFVINYNYILSYMYLLIHFVLCGYYFIAYLGYSNILSLDIFNNMKLNNISSIYNYDYNNLELELTSIKETYDMDIIVFSNLEAILLDYYDSKVCDKYILFLNGNIGTKLPEEIIEEKLTDGYIVVVDVCKEKLKYSYSQVPISHYKWLDENATLIYSSEETGLNYYIAK